jgi:hypothetical protein
LTSLAWSLFNFSTLAARSRSPSATALRRSLAAAGARVFARVEPLQLLHARCTLAVAFDDRPPAPVLLYKGAEDSECSFVGVGPSEAQ